MQKHRFYAVVQELATDLDLGNALCTVAPKTILEMTCCYFLIYAIFDTEG